MILFDGQNADGVSGIHQMKNPTSIYAYDTFGGGTVTIQVAVDVNGSPGTWISTDITFTSNGVKNLFLFGVYWIRAVLQESTSPNLYVRTS